MITLKRPAKEYESEATAFKKEFLNNGEQTINGSELPLKARKRMFI